jgi:hypothetical protein
LFKIKVEQKRFEYGARLLRPEIKTEPFLTSGHETEMGGRILPMPDD